MMKALKWWLAGQVVLWVVSSGTASAQELRRRTLLVTPNQPVAKAPTLLVHKEIATTLVFDEAPKAVKLDTADGRIDVHQTGKSVILFPSVELGNRERITLTVTAPDDAKLLFNVMDGFNSEVDGQVTVRRGRTAVLHEPEDCFLAFVLAQDRQELKEITYRDQREFQPDGVLGVDGTVTALGFAIVLVDLPSEQPRDMKIRLHGETAGDLDIVGTRQDKRGLLVAVKRPQGELDSSYTLELETGEGALLVNRSVLLWPTASAHRTRNK